MITTTTHFTESLFSSFHLFVKACNSADDILIGKNCFPLKMKNLFLEFVVDVIPKLTETKNDRAKNSEIIEAILNLTNRVMVGASAYKLTCLTHVYQSESMFETIRL